MIDTSYAVARGFGAKDAKHPEFNQQQAANVPVKWASKRGRAQVLTHGDGSKSLVP